MSIPTTGEEYSKLMEHIRKAQESAAMLAHLTRDDDKLKAQGWLAVSEMFKLVQHKITDLAVGAMH